MAPFQPSGDRARWQVIYDLLCATEVDGVVTYEHLAAALGMDAKADRHRIQVAMRRAALEHERVDKRAVDAVENVGYRVVRPPEHVLLARRQQRRSSNALERGHSKAVNVDLSQVDETTRQALDMVARAFALQMDFNRRFDVRQRNLEQALGAVTQKANRSAEEIAELRARLDRLEGKA